MNKKLNELKSFELNKRNKIRSNRLMFDIIQSSTDYKPWIVFELQMVIFKFSKDFDVKAQKHPNTKKNG